MMKIVFAMTPFFIFGFPAVSQIGNPFVVDAAMDCAGAGAQSIKQGVAKGQLIRYVRVQP
jgi:hypothetical protein